MWRFVAQVCVEQLVTKNVVGTLGLGYPLLLCLDKGLVVILDYIQTAGPLWSGVLFLSTTAPDLSHNWKGPGTLCVPGKAGAQPKQPGLRTSRGARTPAKIPDP